MRISKRMNNECERKQNDWFALKIRSHFKHSENSLKMFSFYHFFFICLIRLRYTKLNLHEWLWCWRFRFRVWKIVRRFLYYTKSDIIHVCVCQDMQKMPLITFDMEYTSANLSSQQSNLKYFWNNLLPHVPEFVCAFCTHVSIQN